ncbi:unnamed protein product [Effrenium voratum]|nr:unnamed protein product [Effrenium voratum]
MELPPQRSACRFSSRPAFALRASTVSDPMSLPDDESHSPASVSTTCLTSDHSCKPCVFFLKPQGCRNGADCSFCHLCHPKSRKAKKEEMMPKYVEFSEEAVSKGSAKHGVDCKPCAWFWHPNGCQSGSLCEFCHLCPVGELKARQKERTKLLRAAKEQPANQNVAQAQPEEGEGGRDSQNPFQLRWVAQIDKSSTGRAALV